MDHYHLDLSVGLLSCSGLNLGLGGSQVVKGQGSASLAFSAAGF